MVIQNHRDPLKVIASISALGASLREMTTDHFEVDHAGRRSTATTSSSAWTGRWRPAATALFAPGQVVDVRYQDIRHDLIGAIARIYDEIGLELTAEAEDRMRTFLAAHPGDQGRQPQAVLVRRHRAGRGRAARAGPAHQEYFDVESEASTSAAGARGGTRPSSGAAGSGCGPAASGVYQGRVVLERARQVDDRVELAVVGRRASSRGAARSRSPCRRSSATTGARSPGSPAAAVSVRPRESLPCGPGRFGFGALNSLLKSSDTVGMSRSHRFRHNFIS